MARDSADTIVMLAIGGVGLYLVYQMSKNMMPGGASAAPSGTPSAPAAPTNPALPSAPATPTAPAAPAAPVSPYVANPNLRTQMIQWQSARAQKGEPYMDWAAFRAFLAYIGAPDPGPTPLPDFLNPGAGALY